MSRLDYVRQYEYIITLYNIEDWDSLYEELETKGKSPAGTNINRAVKCINRRPISRNGHYFLTNWEADELRNHPKVKLVSLSPKELRIEAGETVTQTSSKWNKSSSITNLHKNYALLRCTEGQQRPGWGSPGTEDQTATISLSQTGKNVDVVIIDGDGFLPNHPEFSVNADGTGGSRATYYNWYQHDPVVKGTPAGVYVNAGNSGSYHAIHVMGTVGGNTQGWARGANLYNIFYFAGDEGNLNFPYVIDYVREFHRNKPINQDTGRKNPTICNNSWGMSIFPGQYSLSDITAVTYRGTRYSSPGTETIGGISGVYTSTFQLASFTGPAENLAQRITTSGLEDPPGGDFLSVPESWDVTSTQAYIFDYITPEPTYTVLIDVDGPCTVELQHWVSASTFNGVSLSGEIILTPPIGESISWSENPPTGDEAETYIKETVVLDQIGTYSVTFNTTLVLSEEDFPIIFTYLMVTLFTAAPTADATVVLLPNETIGSVEGLSSSIEPTVGYNDDGFWELTLPFSITYLSINYSSVFIGTNGFLTFGQGSTIYIVTPSAPNIPKIMVSADDNSVQRIYYGVTGTSPNRIYRIIVEGNASTTGILGSPGMRYEYKFYEDTPTQIDLIIAQNNRKTMNGIGFSTSQLNSWGILEGQRIPQRVSALDADLEDAIDEGIIFVGAAGNGSWKHDVPGGLDWNNTFEMQYLVPQSVNQPYYYMRGSSPSAVDDTINGNFDIPNICVGAIDIVPNERKVYFSDCGPGVDIYAPGHHIISAWNNYFFVQNVPDSRGGGNLAKISGTSMASPQVCGVLACALEIYPNMKQEQAKAYIVGIAKIGQINDTEGGPTDLNSLQGSPNRYLFYRLERPLLGNVFPKLNYNVRPTSGFVYPRVNIRRK